ncbi:MAG: signal peptidase I [Eubacteriales bacterium]|nr:signal peptidase I [Eubacteriales bacterium]
MQLRSTGKEQEYKKHTLWSWCFVLLEAVLAVLLILGFFFRAMRVPNSDMSPTLLQNEVLLIDRLSMYTKTPARGSMQLVEDGSLRRILAFAGERVELVDGLLYVNSFALDESAYVTNPAGNTDDPVTVPDGCVLLLPDDRAILPGTPLTADTLAPCLLPMDRLMGTVRLRVSPLSKINLFV